MKKNTKDTFLVHQNVWFSQSKQDWCIHFGGSKRSLSSGLIMSINKLEPVPSDTSTIELVDAGREVSGAESGSGSRLLSPTAPAFEPNRCGVLSVLQLLAAQTKRQHSSNIHATLGTDSTASKRSAIFTMSQLERSPRLALPPNRWSRQGHCRSPGSNDVNAWTEN